MLGAIIGDMMGSPYEQKKLKTKNFPIFNPMDRMTDDSYLTIAVMKTIQKFYPLNSIKKEEFQDCLIENFVQAFNEHKKAGYGQLFVEWVKEKEKKPYHSIGNGAGMRVSPVGWVSQSEEEVKYLSRMITEVTHNTEESYVGAEAISMAIYLSLHGKTKEEIKERIIQDYYPEIKSFNYQNLLEHSDIYDMTCKGTIPIAIYSFFISHSLLDTIKTAISIGGDSDTIACIAGSIAESYYQKEELSTFEDRFIYYMLDKETENFIKSFYSMIGNHKFENCKNRYKK